MKLSNYQHEELLQLLQNDYDFKGSNNEYLIKGLCPACKKCELFVSRDKPYRICCNRLNKCGFSASTYDLYKDILFANWSKNYQPSVNNPNATADAYMEKARGFNLTRIKGIYKQGSYLNNNQKTATVKFTLCDGKAQWERFIDDVDRFSNQKGRAISSYKGLWWQMPNQQFNCDEVWITEGIFDALSLIHIGKTAIAAISSAHYPDGFFSYLQKIKQNPKIIIALDSDKAGQKAAINHYHKAQKQGFTVKIAIPLKGKDWNDLWRNGQLNQQLLDEALYQGDLLVAKTFNEKALIMYKKSGINNFSFTHNSRTYWFSFNNKIYEKVIEEMKNAGCYTSNNLDEALKKAINVTEIANCSFKPLYFQRAKDGDEGRYFMQIERLNKPEVQDSFSGAQISDAVSFKKRLLSICAGALYEGNNKQLDYIIKENFSNLRNVETIDYCGYVSDLDAWVYKDFAVSNGKVISANSEQFIEIDRFKSIKTISDVAIKLNNEQCLFNWLNDFWNGFGEKGMVALAFFTGTIFVNQIRQKQQSWPFLEITGEAATGKTTLLEFLWRLHGREGYEGFDPNKTSFAGRARNFNKVSGLPVVLIEGDRNASQNRKFEFNELKDLFNGRPMYTRAIKTLGMETNDPPFKGSIIIAQNDQIEADEAILSRIIPLFFTSKNIPQNGKIYVDKLNRLSADELASYLIHMLINAKKILNQYFDNWQSYIERLSNNPNILISRIIHNGAQIMAMFDAIANQIQIPAEITQKTINFIEQICVERQKGMQTEHPLIMEFFNNIAYLESINAPINHSLNDDLLAINLVHMEAISKNAGITMPSRTELNRLLPKTKKHKYLGKKSIRSKQLDGKVIKCILFEIGERND